MPADATVTSFFTFVAGTKARATQVNTNFSNFRGHSLPIDPNTAAGATNTYDLGSSEYQWRNLYLQNAPIIGGQVTASFEVAAAAGGDNPPLIPDAKDSLNVVQFQPSQNQDIDFKFVVPPDYVIGNQIKAQLFGFSDESASGFQIVTEAALLRPAQDNANTTTLANINTSTADITTPTAAGQTFQTTASFITQNTSTGGLINGLTVTAGSVISVKFQRRGQAAADTLTGSFFLTNLKINYNA